MDKRAKTQFWLEFFIDFVSLFVANLVTFVFFNLILKRISDHTTSSWISFYLLLAISFVLVSIGFHTGINLKQRSRLNESISLLQNAVLTYLVFSALTILAKNPVAQSLSLFVTPFVLFIIISGIGRYYLKRWFTGFYTDSKVASIVGVLTTIDRSEAFVEKLMEDWSIKVSGVALLDNFCTDGNFCYDNTLKYDSNNKLNVATKKKIRFPYSVCDVPVIATDIRFLDWIRSTPLDEVYINLPFTQISDISEIVNELESMGVTVHINLPTFEQIITENSTVFNCEFIAGAPMATLSATNHNPSQLVMKRLFDIIGAIFGLIVSFPIILITAIPLLIESPGPLFFKQKRVGKNGRVFNMYKLRSMYADAEKRKAELMSQNKMDGLMFKMDNDPRITKVGKIIRKLSIDELPQFYNVLKGDMSIIGTRPPTVSEFDQYKNHHKRRLSMRPGITGMWQVSGRSNIQNFEEIVKLDCQYIDNWSLWLDVKILFKTIIVVLKHEGAE